MAESKLRVLLVHNFYQIRGGEDSVFENEKRLLEEHGHEVFTYTRHNNEIKTLSWWRKLLLPLTAIFSLRTYRDIKRLISEHRIDVVHVHNTLTLVSPAVYYAARVCRVPVLQTVHNFRFLCAAATFYRAGHICEDCLTKGSRCALRHRCYRNSFAQTLICVLGQKLHRRTGIYGYIDFLCLTEFNRRKLLSLPGINPARVHLKPNYADDWGIPLSTSAREQRFIFAGRLNALKGIPVLLGGWKLLEQDGEAPELLICGGGDSESFCRDYIEKNGLKRVRMAGMVPNAQARELIGNSLAMILPTQWYEGFPVSIVEAFAAGTPVLCSDIGNAGSVVEEGVTGFKFRHDSSESLAAAVKRFLLEKQRDWCETVYAVYKRLYTASANYEQLAAVYHRVRHRGLKLLISLRDQSFAQTKSVGIFNVSLGLVRGLAQCPEVAELHVLANRDCADSLRDLPSHVILHYLKAPTPTRFCRVWWDQWGVGRAIRRIKPDWAILPKGVPPLFPSVGKAKLACFVHDLNWEYYETHRADEDSPYPRYQLHYFRMLHLRALRTADVVLTSTEFNRERFLSHVPQAKVAVVGIGFDEPAQPLRAERGRDIVFYASPYPHKLTALGLQRLEQWWRRREDREAIHVHVLGWLPHNLQLPEEEQWHFCGRIAQGEMMQILTEKARVAVYWSAYEGYGMPPTECLRAGIPCVASDIPSIREHHPAELLFRNEDAASFDQTLERAYALDDQPSVVPYPSWRMVAERALELMIPNKNDALS